MLNIADKLKSIIAILKAKVSRSNPVNPDDQKIHGNAPLKHDDYDFISDSKSALLTKSTRWAGAIIYTVSACILVLLLWAYFAKIDVITVGEGKVVPFGSVKEIQSLDGGIVLKIFVSEGSYVKDKQVLMILDDTRYKSDYQQSYAKYLTLLASVARLTAESQNQESITFPKELAAYPQITEAETKLFETRKKAFAEEISTLETSYKLAMNEVKMYQPLLAKEQVSKVDYLHAERNANEIKSRIIERQSQFNEQIKTDLATQKGQLEIIMNALVSLQDKITHATIRSPVDGIIKKLETDTVGAVIKPGETIMEIVPLGNNLMIEAKVRPSDIAFIHPGQKAVVKITAYDYSIYGDLTGKVEYISADTLEDKSQGQQAGQQAYYIVHVRTNRNYLGSDKHKLPIIPGMIATVHIETDKKTIMQYLLKPLIKAKQEALRER